MVAMSDCKAGAAVTLTDDESYEFLLFKGIKEAYIYHVPPAGTVSSRSRQYFTFSLLPKRSKAWIACFI